MEESTLSDVDTIQLTAKRNEDSLNKPLSSRRLSKPNLQLKRRSTISESNSSIKLPAVAAVEERDRHKRKKHHDESNAELIRLRAEVDRNNKRQATAAAKVAEANEKQMETIRSLRTNLKHKEAELKKKDAPTMNTVFIPQLSGNKRSIRATTTDMTDFVLPNEVPTVVEMVQSSLIELERKKCELEVQKMYSKNLETSMELAKALEQVGWLFD
jgi:hypothetical protein